MAEFLTLFVADSVMAMILCSALIMRRHFINVFARTALNRQAFNAFVEHSARGFQAVYLLLLPGDYFIQGLQQIFLISCFYFQFDYSVIVHKAA